MVILKFLDVKVAKTGGKIGLIAAGTADISVAEEARVSAKEAGCEVICAYDIGIAGVHRVCGGLRYIGNTCGIIKREIKLP